jgi:hypothetical protein
LHPAAQAIAAESTESRNGPLFSRGPDVGIFRFRCQGANGLPPGVTMAGAGCAGNMHGHNSGYQRQCMPRLRELHHGIKPAGLSTVGDHVTQKTQGGTFAWDHDGRDASGLRDQQSLRLQQRPDPRGNDGKLKLADTERRPRAPALPVLSPQWQGPGDDRCSLRPFTNGCSTCSFSLAYGSLH